MKPLTTAVDHNPAPRKAAQWPWILLVILILAASVGGYIALQAFKPKPAIKPLVRHAPIVQLAELHAQSGGLPVAGSGLVSARRELSLATEVQGRIVAVSHKLVSGGTFERGETLIELDKTPFEASLAQARADRQSARAALVLARQAVKRTENLIAGSFQSRQALDERIAGRDQAEAALARAEAVEKQRSLDLARTTLTAPFSGRVLSENVTSGDTAQPGRELARLFDDKALEVTVSLTDTSMALIENPWRESGSPTIASLQVSHGGTVYEWPALVDRVEAAIDNTTRTFSVIVRPTAPEQAGVAVNTHGADKPPGPPLLVGMYATARIAGRELGEHYLLPRRALRDDDKIWIATTAEQIAIVKAEVLAELDDEIAVRLDLHKIDPLGVVISDLQVVTAGMPVRTQRQSDASTSQVTQ